MNEELIRHLKAVKKSLVSKELRGQEWDDRQEIILKLEDAVTYINDCTGKGLEF